jgi:hypothetical protein
LDLKTVLSFIKNSSLNYVDRRDINQFIKD